MRSFVGGGLGPPVSPVDGSIMQQLGLCWGGRAGKVTWRGGCTVRPAALQNGRRGGPRQGVSETLTEKERGLVCSAPVPPSTQAACRFLFTSDPNTPSAPSGSARSQSSLGGPATPRPTCQSQNVQ